MSDDPRDTHLHDQASAEVRNQFDRMSAFLHAAGMTDGQGQHDAPDFVLEYIAQRLGSPTTRSCRHLFDPDPDEMVRKMGTQPIMVHLNVPLIACARCSDEALLIGLIVSRWREDRCDLCDGIVTDNLFAEITIRFGTAIFHGNRGFSCECRPKFDAAGIKMEMRD